jgi:hypothetical protein
MISNARVTSSLPEAAADKISRSSSLCDYGSDNEHGDKMARDEFSDETKRKLAERAGGRCSNPECGKQCWLPGRAPAKTATIGVAAHIRAASQGGPRFDPEQAPHDRKSITNAIYLCSNCATKIDRDEEGYSPELLEDWKHRHEAHIRQEASGTLLLPTVDVNKRTGISIPRNTATSIHGHDIDHLTEHELIISNNTGCAFESFGFRIQYPELIVADTSTADSPPGCHVKWEPDNANIQVQLTGNAQANIPKQTHFRNVTIEASWLAEGFALRLHLQSVPDPVEEGLRQYRDKIGDLISGEVRARRGPMLETQGFTLPLWYDAAERCIRAGKVHDVAAYKDRYVARFGLY